VEQTPLCASQREAQSPGKRQTVEGARTARSIANENRTVAAAATQWHLKSRIVRLSPEERARMKKARESPLGASPSLRRSNNNSRRNTLQTSLDVLPVRLFTRQELRIMDCRKQISRNLTAQSPMCLRGWRTNSRNRSLPRLVSGGRDCCSIPGSTPNSHLQGWEIGPPWIGWTIQSRRTRSRPGTGAKRIRSMRFPRCKVNKTRKPGKGGTTLF
jgi:hypothetical protein